MSYTNGVHHNHHNHHNHNGLGHGHAHGHHSTVHHAVSPPPPQQPPSQHTNHNRQPPPPVRAHREVVTATPSMTLEADRLIIGDSGTYSQRSWTTVKTVGEGSFGTVQLVDWHSPLPPGTRLSPMQCGAGARPEWNGKVLVALKKMTKPWEGGWDDCRKLKELQSLRAIPPHENIIPLYDSFLIPTTKQLYFVFEPMEGNVYQLIRSRKGRPLAQGLVYSIFSQVVNGLHHIHSNGYFHRDMKPENLLVTTTGLAEYAPQKLQDVMVIVKIADFGLARETASLPPYTDYVATRWYRAPEVLLCTRDYSNPVDMWALGAILAELVNLKPLFPGTGEIDQVFRITRVLGEPSDRYGRNERGRVHGGGAWPRGVAMAESCNFNFMKSEPIVFASLFGPTVPRALVDIIEDLLRYDPDARLKTSDLLDCEYVRDMRAQPPPIPITQQPPQPPLATARKQPAASASLPSLTPRNMLPNHMQSKRVAHGLPASQPAPAPNDDADMEDDYTRGPAPPSPVPSSVLSFVERPKAGHDWNAMSVDTPAAEPPQQQQQLQQPQHKGGLMSSLGFKKPLNRLFGGGGDRDKSDEFLSVPAAPSGVKRPQSPSNGPDYVHSGLQHSSSLKKGAVEDPMEQKRMRKELKREQEKAAKAEEKARRAMAEAWHREQARAVMLKRNQMIRQNVQGTDFDWHGSVVSHLDATPASKRAGQQQQTPTQAQPHVVVTAHKEPPPPQSNQHQAGPSSQPMDMQHHANPGTSPGLHGAKSFMSAASSTLFGQHAGMNSMGVGMGAAHHQHPPLPPHPGMPAAGAVHRFSDDSITHRSKARRRDFDDDHSISDVQSISHISMISFATVDSDPGPTPSRRHMHHYSERHAPYPPTSFHRELERSVSATSLRTTTEHSHNGSFDFGSDYGGTPGPRGRLSSATSSFAGSPSPQMRPTGGPPLSPPPMHALSLGNGHAGWRGSDAGGSNPGSPAPVSSSRTSYFMPAMSPIGHGSSINPMFQVPPMPEGSLPPFAQIASIADRQLQPTSPLQHPIPNPEPPD